MKRTSSETRSRKSERMDSTTRNRRGRVVGHGRQALGEGHALGVVGHQRVELFELVDEEQQLAASRGGRATRSTEPTKPGSCTMRSLRPCCSLRSSATDTDE